MIRDAVQSVVLLAFVCASALAQAAPQAAPELKPCDLPGVIGDSLCGEVEVPADHNNTDGKTLRLRVVVLPATETADPDPVVYLAGGPGASAIASAGALSDRLRELRRTHDLVFIDQRGTGGSVPYNCRMVTDDGRTASLGSPSFPQELIEQCGKGPEGYPSRLFTTWQAADDLAAATSALGYDRLNLYGVSYGTRLGLVFLNRHPDRVRTLTVQSVVLPSLPIPLAGTLAAEGSLQRLLADCRADARCQEAFPDLAEETQQLLSRGDESGFVFNTAVTAALYDPRISAGLPAAIHQAAQNQYQPLLNLAAGSRNDSGATGLASGAYLAVLCTEDVPFIDEADLTAAAETMFTDRNLRGLMGTCSAWPKVELPVTARELPDADAPVLLIAGELDPVTSAEQAELAAERLPNSRLIVLRATGHSGASNDCAVDLLTQFVAAGSAESDRYKLLRERSPAGVSGAVPVTGTRAKNALIRT